MLLPIVLAEKVRKCMRSYGIQATFGHFGHHIPSQFTERCHGIEKMSLKKETSGIAALVLMRQRGRWQVCKVIHQKPLQISSILGKDIGVRSSFLTLLTYLPAETRLYCFLLFLLSFSAVGRSRGRWCFCCFIHSSTP